MRVVGVGAFTLPKATFVSAKSIVLVCGNTLCICAPTGEIDSIVQLPQAFGAADLRANWKSGHLLVSAKAEGGPVYVYKLNSMGIVHTLQNPTSSICLGVDSSRDFKRVCAFTDETSSQLLVWDVTSNHVIVQTSAPVPLRGCFFNPSDENYLCAYGSQGIYVGKITSMLGEHSVEFTRVELISEEFDELGLGSGSTPMSPDGVACMAWGLDNIAYVVDCSGIVWQVNTLKLTATVCADIRQEVCGILFTGNNLIATTRNGRVHWVELSQQSQETEQAQIVQTIELEASQDAEPLCTFHSPMFDELITLTSDGRLFQYPLEKQPSSKEEELDVNATTQHMQQQAELLSPILSLQNGIALASTHFQYHNPNADDDISELSVFATASHNGTLILWNETTAGAGPAGALLCALGSYRCMHLSSSSNAPEPSPITAIAGCPVAGVLVIGSLHGIVEMLALTCGAPESDRQICSVEVTVLSRFKLFDHGVSMIAASKESRVAMFSMADPNVQFAGPVGDDSNREMRMLCCADLGAFLPTHAEWVGEDVVIVARSVSDPQATKFVGIHRDYINEALDAEPIPPTWTFMHDVHISGCMYLPLSQTMVLYAHDRCSLWTCSWDHAKHQELANELSRNALAAAHVAPVISACTTSTGEVFATATTNGVVSLWQPTANGIVSVAQSSVHSTCISSMSFGLGGRTFFTSGVDGSVVLHELKNAPSEECSLNFKLLATVANEQDNLPEVPLIHDQEPTWLEAQRKTFAESMVRLHEEGRQAILTKVQEVRESVRDLLQRNEEAEEIERLERSDFVIDKEEECKLNAETQQTTDQIQHSHSHFNLTNEAVAARIKELCWDSQTTHILAVHALARPGAEVRKFGVHGLSPAENVLFEKLKRLRWLEIAHQNNVNARKDIYDGVEAVGQPRHFVTWAANTGHVGNGCTWIHNDGMRWPGSNVIAMLNSWSQAEQSAPVETARKQHRLSHDEDDPGMMENDLPEFDQNDIINYLYPPTAVRTEVQKRTQIVFLQHLICRMKEQFNEHVEKLKNDKEEAVHGINTRNTRIAQIQEELSSEVQLLTIEQHFDETPEQILQLEASELIFEKYETEQQRAERLKHEEEQRKRLEEAQRGNIGARALQDMMYGTLEVPAVSLIESTVLTKPQWMIETPADELTEQQRKEIEEFETRQAELKAEQDKYRKSLELELKKLRGEVNDICKIFDDKLESLSRLYLLVAREVLLQELVVSRLGHSIVERDYLLRSIARMDDQINSIRAECTTTIGTLDKLQEELDAARARGNMLQEEDKLLEKNFRKDLQSVSSIAFDQDTMKVFLQLYKKRFRDAVHEPNTEGSSMADKSSMNTSSQGGNLGQSSMRRSVSHKKSMQMSSVGRKSFSRRASGERGSKQGANSAEQQAYGPLQEAMRALKEDAGALVTEKDPFVQADAARLRAEALLQSQVPKLTQLDQSRDCPETMIIEPLVWSKLQELRLTKIEKEIAIRASNIEQAELKKSYDEVHAALNELENAMAQMEQARHDAVLMIQKADTDVELVIRLKQGQDEVVRDAVVTDYSDALLVPCSIVEAHNATIQAMGDTKIKVLHKIRKYRRRINLVEWGTSHHQLCANDAEQYYTDLQLTKVTRDMQVVLRDGSNQSEGRVAAAVERHRYLSKAFKQQNRKLMKNIQQLEHQLEELQEQNISLDQQVGQQHEKLEARQAIASSRIPDSGLNTSVEKARNAMGTIVMKRKVMDVIKAQADEIEYLKRELDRLCERSFPRFAVANRARFGQGA